MTDPDADLDRDEFERLHGRLLGIGYRMVGTWSDAEEIAAETWLRWQTRRPGEVRSAEAWLTTVATRISLDRWRTLRRRREEYLGPWLPEPVDPGLLPAERAEQRHTLGLGLLHLMERLTPDERAVYVLRHAFDHSYPEIAEILGRTPASVRQLGSRAQRRLGPVPEHRPDAERDGLERLLAAIVQGRVAEAVQLLTEDAVLIADGGGRTRSALRPIHTPEKIVRFLLGITAKGLGGIEPMTVNDDPVLAGRAADGRRLVRVEMRDGRISALHLYGNPDKLGTLPS